VCSVIGTPTKDTYPEGLKLAAAMRFKFPQYVPVNLAQVRYPIKLFCVESFNEPILRYSIKLFCTQ
jgi:hypothetical protein